jgi:lipoic acid synthetase
MEEGSIGHAEIIVKSSVLKAIKQQSPEYSHDWRYIKQIVDAGFKYEKSLGVITAARDFGLVTKSNLILGMGEEIAEVHQALTDLHEAGCDLVTITQYLRPSLRHHPVDRWVRPEEFVELAKVAEEIGFAGVLSGPLVRSSYRAGKLYKQAIASRNSTDV